MIAMKGSKASTRAHRSASMNCAARAAVDQVKIAVGAEVQYNASVINQVYFRKDRWP